ncbi:MAG: DUF2157 domain-containing protein [Thiohalophilus sp.]
MTKHHQWLAQQLPEWVEQAIISESQAEVLRQRYPIRDSVNLGRLLITGIAAMMIGLGVILLFAYNWSEMGRFTKLAVIFVALIGAHGLAFYLHPRHHVYSESLFALGTMLMGAGIFLVAQIYHLDSHYPNAFLFWSLGALALAWALPSLTQAFLTVVLVIGWHLFEVFDFHFANYWAFFIVLLGVMPLLWRLQSPVLARLTAIGLFLTLAFSLSVADEDLVVATLLLMALTLIALARFGEFAKADALRALSGAVAGPAVLVLVGIMYLMTFGDVIPELLDIEFEHPVPASYFVGTLVVSQAAFFGLLYLRRLNGLLWLSELTVVLALLPSVIAWVSGQDRVDTAADIVALSLNLVLLALSVWMMIDGARHANRRHMVQGSILFALLAVARYTDLFESLIARALVFLLVGAALFAVSHFYQRNKKQVAA